MPFTLYEPAPTHPNRMGYGRGGAGNRTRPLPPTSLKAAVAPPPPPPQSIHSTSSASSTNNFSTGRGGAGNMHNTGEERRIFSFDEELAKQGKATAAPVYHIGRGGQGNAVVERRESDASRGSRSSEESGKRGSLEWVRGLARTSRS